MNKTKAEIPAGINWVNSAKFSGYLARIYYPDNEVISRAFSVARYGSQESALAAAIRWRAEEIQRNPPPPKKPHRDSLIASNTSGFNGISITYKRERNGKKTEVINVSYSLRPNEPKCKSYRIHLFPSFDSALQEALKFRAEMERKSIQIRKREKLWPYDKKRGDRI